MSINAYIFVWTLARSTACRNRTVLLKKVILLFKITFINLPKGRLLKTNFFGQFSKSNLNFFFKGMKHLDDLEVYHVGIIQPLCHIILPGTVYE